LPEINPQGKFRNPLTGRVLNSMQKPISLYYLLLAYFGEDIGKTLSICSGSGSFAIACLLFRCSNVSIEIDSEMWSGSCSRFQEVQADKDETSLMALVADASDYIEATTGLKSYTAMKKYDEYMQMCAKARSARFSSKTSVCCFEDCAMQKFSKQHPAFTCGNPECTKFFHLRCSFMSDLRTDEMAFCSDECKKLVVEQTGSSVPSRAPSTESQGHAAAADAAASNAPPAPPSQ